VVTVEVPVPTNDVGTPMRKMRRWLDDMRFDRSSLTWTVITGSIVVRVGFKAVEEATAFAKHFAGRVL
jgi:glutamate dehydrogenase/leucine dehydrogenase